MGQCEMKISAKQIGTPLNMCHCGVRKNLREGKNEVLAFRILQQDRPGRVDIPLYPLAGGPASDSCVSLP